MSHTAITPSIGVTIGRQSRFYRLFIAPAPVTFDAPATMILYAALLGDVVGFALYPVPLDTCRAGTPSPLSLIDATDLGWQRVCCHDRGQRLIWQRLQGATTTASQDNARRRAACEAAAVRPVCGGGR
jgi:hypothetical protein